MFVAGRLGIEPRFTASKAAVLPLDDLPPQSTNLRIQAAYVKRAERTTAPHPVFFASGTIIPEKQTYTD